MIRKFFLLGRAFRFVSLSFVPLWFVSFLALFSASLAVGAELPAGINQWAEANGASLRYQLSGPNKNTLVFIHEMTMSLESWDYILPAFDKTHRVLRYDMRGWGLSEKLNGDITMDQAVEDLRALLDALNIKDKVVLIGGAAGADVALNFAVKYPERVKGVATFSAAVNLNPQPRAAPPGGGAPGTGDPYEAVYPQALRNDPVKWARFVGINKASDPQSARLWAAMVASFDFAPVLPKISVPTLVAGTSLYRQRSMAMMKAIADAIPKGEFVELKTGHFAALESPELVIPVLTKFLNKVATE